MVVSVTSCRLFEFSPLFDDVVGHCLCLGSLAWRCNSTEKKRWAQIDIQFLYWSFRHLLPYRDIRFGLWQCIWRDWLGESDLRFARRRNKADDIAHIAWREERANFGIFLRSCRRCAFDFCESYTLRAWRELQPVLQDVFRFIGVADHMDDSRTHSNCSIAHAYRSARKVSPVLSARIFHRRHELCSIPCLLHLHSRTARAARLLLSTQGNRHLLS